ncbi:MAG: phosphoesterase [Staphylothermus sp.]|nr:phosphoesterase [Staphylothermus sp.]
MSNNRYVIITHTDMDGIGSAAIYTYYRGTKPYKIFFTEPYLLYRVLKRIKSNKSLLNSIESIALMDLGLNLATVDKTYEYIKSIINDNISIEWYDHHIWDSDWRKKFEDLGVKIHIDTSTCATGVVAKYSKIHVDKVDEESINEVVGGICAGDLWRFDHWRGPWFLRLIRRRDSQEWRMYVTEKIAQGIVWCEEFTKKVVERFEQEIQAYNEVRENIIVRTIGNLKIAIALQHPILDNSFTAAFIIGRTDADIAVITSRDGKISLRSREYNVRDLAKYFGGGGHPRAAGFKINIPLLVKLKSLFNKNAIMEYILDLIEEAIKKS